MTRHECREAVFSLIFEAEFNREKTADEIIADAVEIRGLKNEKYIIETFRGVMANIPEIDETISTYAENWKISRMSKASRSILRLAVYEMMFTEVPPKAVINEAVEIAKDYDDKAASGFINGILNKIAREKGFIKEVVEQ